MNWKPISEAPKPHQWLERGNNCKFLLGLWHVGHDEDGEPTEGEWLWQQVAYLTSNGWQVGTGGFKGVHGYASFPLNDNATHFIKLDEGPNG